MFDSIKPLKSMKAILILSLSLIIFSSCKKDPDIYFCPNEIKYILETFKNEGDARGHKIFFNGLKVYLVDELPGTTIGVYKPSEHSIYIDTSVIAYKQTPEALLFHELAHGVLNRDHKQGVMPNGIDITSIMHPFSLPTYEWNNHQYKRQYYIDEMFNESTPIPSWGN